MTARAMRMAVIGIFAVLLTVVDANALVGNQWKQFPQAGKQGYIMGVIDSWNLLRGLKELVKQTSPNVVDMVAEIAECAAAERFSYEQIIAIVEKYMAENPASWHYDMSSLILSALSPPCKAYKKE